MTTSQRWAALASVLVGIIGLQWWLTPETYPFGPGDDAGDLSLLTRLESGSAAALAAILGAVGVITAWAMSRRRLRGLALVSAAIQIVVLGYVVPDITALMVVAYALALVGPVAVVGLVAYRGMRRWPDGGTVVLAAVGCTALLSGIVTPSAVGGLARGIGAGFAEVGTRPLYLLAALTVGVLWAAVGVESVRDRNGRCVECGRVAWGGGSGPTAPRPGVAGRRGRPPSDRLRRLPAPEPPVDRRTRDAAENGSF